MKYAQRSDKERNKDNFYCSQTVTMRLMRKMRLNIVNK